MAIQKDRNEFIDFMKGILIILVVVGHVIQFLIYKNSGFWSDPVFKLIYMFHMPMFMLVSGYLAYPGLNKSVSIKNYIVGKIKSYLIPIVVWSVLFRSIVLAGHWPGINEALHAYLSEIAFTLWFLWALFGSILIVLFAIKIKRFAPVVWIALIFCLIMIIPDYGNIYLFKYVFPYFCLGVGLNKIISEKKWFMGKVELVALFGVSTVLALWCYFAWTDNTYVYISHMQPLVTQWEEIILRWVSGLLVMLAMYCVFKIAHDNLHKKIAGLVSHIGCKTLGIYIIQTYIIKIFDKTFTIDIPLGASRIVACIVLSAVILGVCVFIGNVLSKFSLSERVLLGQKG